MKKLLIGLLALGSISCFAKEYRMFFNGSDVRVNVSGEMKRILVGERNADFFCTSKGFDSSTEYSTEEVKEKVAYDILPNGEKASGWVSNDVVPSRTVITSVTCLKEVNKI